MKIWIWRMQIMSKLDRCLFAICLTILSRVCKQFCPIWLRQGVPSPFDTIQSLDKYCTTVALNERHLPLVVWDPEHKEIAIRGRTISNLLVLRIPYHKWEVPFIEGKSVDVGGRRII